jgi:hypothetical protein
LPEMMADNPVATPARAVEKDTPMMIMMPSIPAICHQGQGGCSDLDCFKPAESADTEDQ